MTHSLPIFNVMYTIYANKEELIEFFESSESTLIGVAYEWENENVIHIHTKPLNHSFGRVLSVLFCRDFNDANGCLQNYVVVINNLSDFNGKLYKNENGSLTELTLNYIPSRKELYSRSNGLLEVDILNEKRVVIIGLGSFGSQISIELAKAGVGKFSLFDFDRVELHNLARHTSYANDLGRLKTDVISDCIKGKNPYAIVDKFPIDINRNYSLLSAEIEKADIVVCATDNNPSRFNISKILVEKQKVGIFGRAITRAEGGDIFKYVPGGACYSCLIGNTQLPTDEISDEVSARRDGRIAGYMSSEDAAAIVQVGLSSDIEPICNMMVKLVLVELSKGLQSGISSLENDLIFNYYLWANRRERHYARWAEFPKSGNRPTVMRWYGAQINKNCHCPICSTSNIILDEGHDLNGDTPNKDDYKDVNLDEL